MIIAFCILGLLLAAAASAVYSGAETGIYCINRLNIRLASGHGDRSARRIQTLLDDEENALAVTLVGTNVANYLATAFTAIVIGRIWEWTGGGVELATTLFATPMLFVFGEVLPKSLFQHNADRLLTKVGGILFWSRWIFSPVLWGIRALNRAVSAMLKNESAAIAPDDLRFRMANLLREELDEGDHLYEPGELVNRVLSASETHVSQVAIARDQVLTVPAHADRTSFERLARRSPFNRFPVCDPVTNEVIGVIHTPSLLGDQSWTTVAERIQTPARIKGHESVAEGLLKVRGSGHSMAIVTDGRDRWVGIVTLKDLLEQIVGDLEAW